MYCIINLSIVYVSFMYFIIIFHRCIIIYSSLPISYLYISSSIYLFLFIYCIILSTMVSGSLSSIKALSGYRWKDDWKVAVDTKLTDADG